MSDRLSKGSEISSEHLDRAIGNLPTLQRQVLTYRFYDSRSFKEIAELLEASEETVNRVYEEAMIELNRLLPLAPNPTEEAVPKEHRGPQ